MADPFAEDRAIAELRAMRLEAAFLAARWRSHPKRSALLAGLAARARSLEACLALESRLAEEEVRLLALIDAGQEVSRLRGELAAERARLEARVQVEKRAYLTTRKLFDIRSAALS